MGNLVNPIAFRLKNNIYWNSVWVTYQNNNYSYIISSDYLLHLYINWFREQKIFSDFGWYHSHYKLLRISGKILIFFFYKSEIFDELFSVFIDIYKNKNKKRKWKFSIFKYNNNMLKQLNIQRVPKGMNNFVMCSIQLQFNNLLKKKLLLKKNNNLISFYQNYNFDKISVKKFNYNFFNKFQNSVYKTYSITLRKFNIKKAKFIIKRIKKTRIRYQIFIFKNLIKNKLLILNKLGNIVLNTFNLNTNNISNRFFNLNYRKLMYLLKLKFLLKKKILIVNLLIKYLKNYNFKGTFFNLNNLIQILESKKLLLLNKFNFNLLLLILSYQEKKKIDLKKYRINLLLKFKNNYNLNLVKGISKKKKKSYGNLKLFNKLFLLKSNNLIYLFYLFIYKNRCLIKNSTIYSFVNFSELNINKKYFLFINNYFSNISLYYMYIYLFYEFLNFEYLFIYLYLQYNIIIFNKNNNVILYLLFKIIYLINFFYIKLNIFYVFFIKEFVLNKYLIQYLINYKNILNTLLISLKNYYNMINKNNHEFFINYIRFSIIKYLPVFLKINLYNNNWNLLNYYNKIYFYKYKLQKISNNKFLKKLLYINFILYNNIVWTTSIDYIFFNKVNRLLLKNKYKKHLFKEYNYNIKSLIKFDNVNLKFKLIKKLIKNIILKLEIKLKKEIKQHMILQNCMSFYSLLNFNDFVLIKKYITKKIKYYLKKNLTYSVILNNLKQDNTLEFLIYNILICKNLDNKKQINLLNVINKKQINLLTNYILKLKNRIKYISKKIWYKKIIKNLIISKNKNYITLKKQYKKKYNIFNFYSIFFKVICNQFKLNKYNIYLLFTSIKINLKFIIINFIYFNIITIIKLFYIIDDTMLIKNIFNNSNENQKLQSCVLTNNNNLLNYYYLLKHNYSIINYNSLFINLNTNFYYINNYKKNLYLKFKFINKKMIVLNNFLLNNKYINDIFVFISNKFNKFKFINYLNTNLVLHNYYKYLYLCKLKNNNLINLNIIDNIYFIKNINNVFNTYFIDYNKFNILNIKYFDDKFNNINFKKLKFTSFISKLCYIRYINIHIIFMDQYSFLILKNYFFKLIFRENNLLNKVSLFFWDIQNINYYTSILLNNNIMGNLKVGHNLNKIIYPIMSELTKQNNLYLGWKFGCFGRFQRRGRARKQWYKQCKVPLSTVFANIDYSFNLVHLRNGVCSIKIYLIRRIKYNYNI